MGIRTGSIQADTSVGLGGGLAYGGMPCQLHRVYDLRTSFTSSYLRLRCGMYSVGEP